MSKLTIIRGLPGAGKSTVAKQLEDFSAVWIEADMFFTANTGKYEFNFEQLGTAHRWCLTTAKAMLRNNHDVIVANTFTTWQEVKDYLKFVIENNCEYEVITLTSQYGSIHGVPEETMEKMRNRFQSHEHILEQAEMLKQK